MNGYIVADEDAGIYRFFGYQVYSPQDVRQALADNPPGETLTLEINNAGGSLFAGFEIYSVLLGAQCRAPIPPGRGFFSSRARQSSGQYTLLAIIFS